MEYETWARKHVRENPTHRAREGLEDPGSCYDCPERSPIYQLVERKGRPLGAASGGEPGFWDRFGYDEGGLPAHLPMGVTARGEGPENDSDAHHYICWCGDLECPLTLALGHAWKSGRRSNPPGEPCPDPLVHPGGWKDDEQKA